MLNLLEKKRFLLSIIHDLNCTLVITHSSHSLRNWVQTKSHGADRYRKPLTLGVPKLRDVHGSEIMVPEFAIIDSTVPQQYLLEFNCYFPQRRVPIRWHRCPHVVCCCNKYCLYSQHQCRVLYIIISYLYTLSMTYYEICQQLFCGIWSHPIEHHLCHQWVSEKI